jgi:hypothetical protein
MPLTLRPNTDSAAARLRTEHHVMSGELRVGRIYKRESSKPELQWLWAINGVPLTGPDVMRVAGTAATFEEAEAQLKENWDKWLAWAKLLRRVRLIRSEAISRVWHLFERRSRASLGGGGQYRQASRAADPPIAPAPGTRIPAQTTLYYRHVAYKAEAPFPHQPIRP